MLFTIFGTVISITAFSVTKKPKKSRKKAEPDRSNTSSNAHQDVAMGCVFTRAGLFNMQLALLGPLTTTIIQPTQYPTQYLPPIDLELNIHPHSILALNH